MMGRLSHWLLLFFFFFKGCYIGTSSKVCLLLLLLFNVSGGYTLLQASYCHEEESSALLQFKQSFTIDESASGLEGAYPKVLSWKPAQGGKNTSCCTWDGVECDKQTGHVIGLHLRSSCLYGSINSNSSLFRLVHLQKLDLADNHFNYSQIPTSISNLPKLTYLDLSQSVFSGRVPSEISQLVMLSVLNLSYNLEPSASAAVRLLKLDESNFRTLTQNLINLEHLRLRYVNISSTIPNSVANLSFLKTLDLGYNGLSGSFPTSFSNLTNLETLYLPNNNLAGIVKFQTFQNLHNLKRLSLMDSSLNFTSETTINASTVPQFTILKLNGCNIREIPNFLRYQKRLEILHLRNNKMWGQVPKWMWNMSTESLVQLDLSRNFLSGQLPVFSSWVNTIFLSFADNMFHGSLPIPASSTVVYQANDNKFTGYVSPVICNMSHLLVLELSNNNLSGMIPQCLGNFSDSLQLLNLQNNSFHGILPQTYSSKSNLKLLDVSQNQLQGRLPRSLVNCQRLQSLVLSNNHFSDVFPFWMSTLPELKVVAMRENRFHGVIGKPENSHQFPKLRVLDISLNNFTGKFVAEYIFSKYAMRSVSQSTYMSFDIDDISVSGIIWFSYGSKFSMTIKGVDRYYSKVQEAFAVIDISSNQFEGEIDEYIGSLKGLTSLNFSNNHLSGRIPLSFGNLANLESLDLSNNKLSGEIPPQLAKLTFLAHFNVSHNNLTGLIPLGTQFNTFNITSYEGNPGLCGDPLPKRCWSFNAPPRLPPSSKEENDYVWFGIKFEWTFVLAGGVSGLLVGVVLAEVVITKKRELFLQIVGEFTTGLKRFGC